MSSQDEAHPAAAIPSTSSSSITAPPFQYEYTPGESLVDKSTEARLLLQQLRKSIINEREHKSSDSTAAKKQENILPPAYMFVLNWNISSFVSHHETSSSLKFCDAAHLQHNTRSFFVVLIREYFFFSDRAKLRRDTVGSDPWKASPIVPPTEHATEQT